MRKTTLGRLRPERWEESFKYKLERGTTTFDRGHEGDVIFPYLDSGLQQKKKKTLFFFRPVPWILPNFDLSMCHSFVTISRRDSESSLGSPWCRCNQLEGLNRGLKHSTYFLSKHKANTVTFMIILLTECRTMVRKSQAARELGEVLSVILCRLFLALVYFLFMVTIFFLEDDFPRCLHFFLPIVVIVL